jgi:Tfp pilus assembly protein PilX
MPSQNIKHQSGAVLVISLILLLVLTLMGVTSMSVTTSELKIASNQQEHNNSYEGALSVLDTVKRSPAIVWVNVPTADVVAPVPQDVAVSAINGVGTGFEGVAKVSYDHCICAVEGNSLLGDSQDGDPSCNFGRVVQEIVATGNAMTTSQITATSTMVNGVSIGVAACP